MGILVFYNIDQENEFILYTRFTKCYDKFILFLLVKNICS